jgi:hypothetical protein
MVVRHYIHRSFESRHDRVGKPTESPFRHCGVVRATILGIPIDVIKQGTFWLIQILGLVSGESK